VRRYHADKTLPTNGEVFVFGSNEAGIHGLGAALEARKSFGASIGVGVGYMSAGGSKHSYAIPTKNKQIRTLSMGAIQGYITEFVMYAKDNSQTVFFITRIGCGLAGYKDYQIAPLFKDCGDNVIFPKEWEIYLK
jgi:hypothetical protein